MSPASDDLGEGLLPGADLGQVVGIMELRGKAGGDAIHQGQRVEEVVQVREVDLADHGGAVRKQRHQPVARQSHQRFTDRGARHRQAVGKADLVDRFAGLQDQVQDFVAQRVVDEPRAGAALAFLWVFFGHVPPLSTRGIQWPGLQA